jgi:hypothetical protein
MWLQHHRERIRRAPETKRAEHLPRQTQMTEPEITLTIKIKDRYYSMHEREIIKVDFETDDAFFERAKKLLEKLREEAP